MQHHVRGFLSRLIGAALVAVFVMIAVAGPAAAATTGSLSGTVTDAATKKPLAGATVTAASPSGRGAATTDANGFYNIYNLAPDTYTVSITAKGYEDIVTSGVTIVQDQNVQINQPLAKRLQTIGRTSARSASNLVQPNQTADVYNVSNQQLSAAAGSGGHRTLYDVIQTTAGITSTGVAGRPRIRGSDVGDVAWEYDGIPINDRLTGLFTTNLSIVGTQNLEVYTGGYSAQYGNAAAGIINSVVKRGTTPGFGSFMYSTQFPASEHVIQAEYGGATPNNKFSWYASLDWANSDPVFANGYQPFVRQSSLNLYDNVPSTIYSRDAVANFHWRPTDKDDVQLLVQTGNLKLPWDKALTDFQPLAVKPCNGLVVKPGTPTVAPVVTNPGVSDTGVPCTTASGASGMQYYAVGQQDANTWYHWSNLAKIQWNHIINDKLFGQFRLAENFNQYIFYQPVETGNSVDSPGGVHKPGEPFDWINGYGWQDEYSDRRSQMYIARYDLTYTPNARSTWYGGASYEYDNSAERYFDFCGCDDGWWLFGGIPWNINGTWPQLFLAVDYPLTLPSAYLGTKQTFGKLVIEPSLRFDSETYHIPSTPDYTDPATGKVVKSYAYGSFSTHAWQPRFAFSWAPNATSAIRGSYGTTTTFVPAAYVFNSSPNGIFANNARAISPYYPGSTIVPQINYNADLSYSQSLRNGVDSWRVSPFYRHATNKLELVKPYTIDPVTGKVTLRGTSYFRTGIENRATGVEFGWNHQVRGDGFSWYLSGTYVNYWGSVTAGALAGGTPYGNITSSNSYLAAFLATKTLFRNPSQPPWNLAWTGDYNQGPYHVRPFVIYQVGAPYNVTGTTCTDQHFNPAGSTTKPCPPALTDTQVHYAKANWWIALDVGYDVYRKNGRTVTLGMNVRNLFNQPSADVYPSTNAGYGVKPNPDLATYGPGSVPNTLYYYAPDAQPTQYQVYLRTKF